MYVYYVCIYISGNKLKQYSQENTCVGVSFYLKDIPTQVFSCEYIAKFIRIAF